MFAINLVKFYFFAGLELYLLFKINNWFGKLASFFIEKYPRWYTVLGSIVGLLILIIIEVFFYIRSLSTFAKTM